MSPEQKPEWFQIADADNAASTRKISKGLPIMALVAVAAIIGVGAVVAQTQEEPPANATETVAPAVVSSSQSSASSESVAPTVIDSATPSAAAVAPSKAPDATTAPAKKGVANPKIGQLPTGGEHEDGEDEGKHRGNHEGGEHEGGGEDD